MSLIQEALRRQQEDGGGSAGQVRPPSQPPLPGPPESAAAHVHVSRPPPPLPAKRPRIWLAALGIAAFAAVLVGAGVLLVVLAKRQLAGGHQAAARGAGQPAAAPDRPAEAPAASKPPLSPAAPEPPVAEAPEVRPAADAAAHSPTGAPPSSAAAEQAQRLLKPAEVGQDWPVLKLMGIMRQGVSGGAAVLNGRLAGLGETIQGVTVVEIGADSVKLKRGSDVLTLYVGESTR